MRRGRPAQRASAEGAPEPWVSTAHHPAARVRPATDLRSLPGRLDWNAAVERESIRAARYGRPAAVVIVELKGERPDQAVEPYLRALAGPLARTLRGSSRATDLVARVASTRFQILLPETSEAGAGCMAERLAASCRSHIQATGAPVAVRVSVAGTGLYDTLQDALAHALRAIEAA